MGWRTRNDFETAPEGGQHCFVRWHGRPARDARQSPAVSKPLPRRAGFRFLGALAFALSTLARPAAAQRAPFPIPDPDPEVERRSFIVADGFEVNLFAADPIIAKPLQINFDPEGRLWVASSEVYPQIKPGQVANDKVLVVEDRDGDGKADRTTVFADGLLIPTGVEPGDGGAYVANSTELLHLKDTDGDGKADKTRVVLSGFGTEDTHHILHTLRWGHDGRLYFNQSVYIHSHIETPWGVRRLNGGGIWRFRPETSRLDVFVRGLINPWGHHDDFWGQSFATDGAGSEGINYCVPGASYMWAVGATRVLPGLNPGSPKYCGLEVVSGRHVPEDWRGNLLTNDFRGNRVCRFVLGDDGAGFSAREQKELIKTKHVAFRPIDVKMGPDGAIYIADWYNPIIQHGEVDFRDPRRDHTRGRIWRVTARGRPLAPRPKLVGASTKGLIEALRSPEQYTRRQALRVLQERGRKPGNDVVAALKNWAGGLRPGGPKFEHERLEALWAFQALDRPEPALLEAALRSPEASARAAAVRIVPDWKGALDDPVALLGERALDENPRVRIEAVRALARFPTARAASRALAALDRPVDRFLDYALWLTARDLAPAWLPEARAGRFDDGGHPARLVFALEALSAPEAVPPLLALLRAGKVAADQEASVSNAIAELGAPSDLSAMLDLVLNEKGLSGARRAGLLDALARASTKRKVVPAGDLARALSLLADPDEGVRAAAIRAVGAWHVTALGGRLATLAAAPETTAPVRAAAIEALARVGGAEGRQALESLAETGATTTIQGLALSALVGLDASSAAPRVAAWLARLAPEPANVGTNVGANANTNTDAVADAAHDVLARLLERKGGPKILAEAIASGGRPIAADLAKLGVRQANASTNPDARALIAAFEKAGGLGPSARPMTDQEFVQVLRDVARHGDPARGERIFRRKELTCLNCHAIAGAGGQVGPGLESIGASAQPDYLLTSLLDPNKQVKENYHATNVATTDGRVLTGIKLRQTDTELVLRDANDQEIEVPLKDVEETAIAGSIMPRGLADLLTRPELVDLVRFLSELGKVGPYAVGTERVCRRWRVLEPTAAAIEALKHAGPEAAFHDGPQSKSGPNSKPRFQWRPAYTTVAGLLPLSEWRADQARSGALPPVVLARTELDVSAPGPIKLSFNSTRGLSFWVDGRPAGTIADAPNALVLDLANGRHVLNVAIDPAERGAEGVRCVLDDVHGSKAQARVVLGK